MINQYLEILSMILACKLTEPLELSLEVYLIVFLSPVRYEIRGNPSYGVTPPTTDMFSDSDSCLGQGPIKRQWSGIFPDPGETCPVQQYYLSGFLPLQTLVDFTKIRVKRIAFLVFL